MAQREIWQIADDANVLKRASAISNDPIRLKEAKDYIQAEIDNANKVLGKNRNNRHNNPATVAKLAIY